MLEVYWTEWSFIKWLRKVRTGFETSFNSCNDLPICKNVCVLEDFSVYLLNPVHFIFSYTLFFVFNLEIAYVEVKMPQFEFPWKPYERIVQKLVFRNQVYWCLHARFINVHVCNFLSFGFDELVIYVMEVISSIF